jgi:hypothetical protein
MDEDMEVPRMRLLLCLICVPLLLAAPAVTAGEIGVPDNDPTKGTACNAIPFSASFMGGEACYQALVPASMLGTQQAMFTELSFAACSNPPANFVATNFDVTIAHTTLTKLSPTFATNLSKDATVVYSGSITFVGVYQKWAPLGLTKPFQYNGSDNVVVEIRYKGATGGFSCYRVGTIERSYATGSGAYTATTSRGGGMAALKMQFKTPDIQLTLSGSTKPGGKVTLDLLSPADASLAYQMGSSLGNGPTPIGSRQLGLTTDDLLVVTTGNLLPSIFVGYTGFLDAGGKAQGAINIPNNSGLIGVRIYSAFVTLDKASAFGIKSISPTKLLTVQ